MSSTLSYTCDYCNKPIEKVKGESSTRKTEMQDERGTRDVKDACKRCYDEIEQFMELLNK